MSSYNRFILNMLPFSLRDTLLEKRRLNYRKKIISEWAEKGRPLPPPHPVKQTAIEEYQKKFLYDTLIETGTYKGDMVETQRRNFKKIYSIELGADLYRECKERFKRFGHITLLQGDSTSVLPELMKGISQPAVFWLDGHYSGGVTALGAVQCPIYGELKSIFANDLKHVILIDDAKDFNGTKDYPSIEELSKFILNIKPNYSIEVKDNIIRVFPSK